MSWKCSFISVIQLKLWNLCIIVYCVFLVVLIVMIFGSHLTKKNNSLSQQIRIWWHAIIESTQNNCKGFLSLQNGLSVWFTRLHNHGEDCWSDSCPKDKSLTPFIRRVSHKHSLSKKLAFHRVLYSSMLTESWVEGKSVEEKDAQPTERTTAFWGLSSKIDSRIWVNFTRNELRLGSRHQEPPPHTHTHTHIHTRQEIWLQLSSETSYLG